MSRRFFVRHPDDAGIDEVLFVAPVPGTVVPKTIDEAQRHAFLRLAIIERYKTSRLSGDEWRFSSGLYVRELPRADWRLISTYGDLKFAMACVYPELYGDFVTGKWTAGLASAKVGAVVFHWKNCAVWSASYDGRPTDLLVAAGHLALAWVHAGEEGSPAARTNDALCAQPGCAQPRVSVYRLKKRYCERGHASDPFNEDVRGFCARHLRRGDCGLEDADANYEVLEGPGPDGHEPDAKVVRQAVTAPPIVLPPDAGTPR